MLAQEFLGPEVSWFALTPLLVLVGGALALLVLGSLTPRWPKGGYAFACATTAGAAAVLAMFQWDDVTDDGSTRSRRSSRSSSARPWC
jgi:NADH-quinone oxidoreductase subunit N